MGLGMECGAGHLALSLLPERYPVRTSDRAMSACDYRGCVTDAADWESAPRDVSNLTGEFRELGVAAVVAGVGDELRGGFVVRAGVSRLVLRDPQASLLQVVIGEEQPHAAAGGEDADFV